MSQDRKDDRSPDGPPLDAPPFDAPEDAEWEEEPSTSLLHTTWFRILLVVVAVGAAAGVSVPYVLDARAPATSLPVLSQDALAPPVDPGARAAAPPLAAAPGPTTAAGPPGPAPASRPDTVPGKPARRPPAEPSRAVTQRATVVGVRASTSTPQATNGAAARPAKGQNGVPSEAGTITNRGESSSRSPAASREGARAEAVGRTVGGEHGDHWVQVGAFRDPATAERVAARLREQHFRVDASASVAPPPAATSAHEATARYDVFLPDPAPDGAVARLTAMKLSPERVPGGLLLTRATALRDAVALARTLTGEGLRVQVRRTEAPPSGSPVGNGTLHRVRVGAFADRTAALEALRMLEERGFHPFVIREARGETAGTPAGRTSDEQKGR